MKKLLVLSVLAMAMTLVSMQEASAWSNIKLGAGFNFQWQTGNNHFLHHVWNNGQVPGGHTMYDYPYAQGPAPMPYGAPMQFSAPMPAEHHAYNPMPAHNYGYTEATPVNYYTPDYSYYTPTFEGYGQ